MGLLIIVRISTCIKLDYLNHSSVTRLDGAPNPETGLLGPVQATEATSACHRVRSHDSHHGRRRRQHRQAEDVLPLSSLRPSDDRSSAPRALKKKAFQLTPEANPNWHSSSLTPAAGHPCAARALVLRRDPELVRGARGEHEAIEAYSPGTPIQVGPEQSAGRRCTRLRWFQAAHLPPDKHH